MKRRGLGYGVLAAVVVTVCLVSGSTPAHSQNQTGAPSGSAQTPLKGPPWAFPVMEPGLQREKDDGTLKRVPGSTKAFTQTQINDPWGPPDWYPDEHAPMPEVVAHGRKPEVRACSQCHLPNGLGHPESTSLAGLPASYIAQQMADFKSGARRNTGIMITIAMFATDAEVKASAGYFAALKMQPWARVVEADTVPKTYVGLGNMRFVSKTGGTEPIGQRIIELPEDQVRAELRDSHSGFVAYVPVGSIQRGEALVTTGGTKTIRCGICHGPDLKGLAGVPGIAGRSPIYIVRQVYNFKNGFRTGLWSELMKEAVSQLTMEDMVAIAAYTASRVP
jgi:cytochrome c553